MMRLGLAGLPGTGKTTLFSALAGRRVAAGKGREETGQALLNVPDGRVDKLSALYRPKKTVYAQITFLDPPAPAAKAEDPAAKMPQELKYCDGLVEVVRNFDAGLGPPKPKEDHQAFAEEMILSDLVTVENRLERIAKERQRGRPQDQEEVSLLERAKEQLSEERPLRLIPEVAGNVKLKGFGLFTAKPLIVVSNNEDDDPKPCQAGGQEPTLVVRAALESELADLEPDERAEFMVEWGLKQSALDRLIQAAYRALDLASFFTVGDDEVRAWTIVRGTLAPQAAGVIHSDMEKGFIRAEVFGYEDLMAHGSEANLKKAGLLKVVGKDYPVADGDIFHVRFNI